MESNHYVDDEKLYLEMVKYCDEYSLAKKTKSPLPRASNYIGQCVMLIAQNLAKKGNYSNYPFIDDMISDSIENCLKYMHNFDYKKYKKPFNYFTTIISYAFWRRINDEKKILRGKNDFLENTIINGSNYASIDGSALYEEFNVRKEDVHSDWDDAYRQKILDEKEETAYNESEGVKLKKKKPNGKVKKIKGGDNKKRS